MSKKVVSVFMAVIFAALVAFLTVGGAEAFCIYNKTDTEIKFHQSRGGSTSVDQFTGKLGPGGQQCCNWKNKDCNKEGNRDSTLVFNVEKNRKKIKIYAL